MPFSGLTRLIGKAFRFSFKRPIQRFNIYNRMLKRLGPDSKYFAPAPRHDEANTQRYLSLIKLKQLSEGQKQALLPETYNPNQRNDKMILDSKLNVNKVVTLVEADNKRLAIDDGTTEVRDTTSNKPHRPLPKNPNLNMDPLLIWKVDKTPPGRLNLDMLQEIMLNKVADDNYWTPKAVAEKYNIREDYAENLLNHCRQIRVIISPRVAKNLDYVGRTNEVYQATKHLVYIVDKSLRNEEDRQYDSMFLPHEELDPEVRELIEPLEVDTPRLADVETQRIAAESAKLLRPEPLKIAPLNVMPEQSDREARLAEKRRVKGVSNPKTRLSPPSLPIDHDISHQDELMRQSNKPK